MTPPAAHFTVEIYSDLVCPWCFIGKRRFTKALDILRADDDAELDFEVVYRPFQLDPRAPRGRAEPLGDVYARKFGGPERAAQIIAEITTVAAAEGLEFHLDRAVRANTADSHRLLWWTLWQHGADVQADLKEALMTAYFTDGADLGDYDVLVDRAVACGLDEDRVRDFLTLEGGLEALAVAQQQAADRDITAVPTYVVDGQWSIPGAQDPEVFVNAFRRLAAKRVAG